MDYIKEEIIGDYNDYCNNTITIDAVHIKQEVEDSEEDFDHVENSCSNIVVSSNKITLLEKNEGDENSFDISVTSFSGNNEVNHDKSVENSSNTKVAITYGNALKNSALCALSVYGDSDSESDEDTTNSISELQNNCVKQSLTDNIKNKNENLSSAFTTTRHWYHIDDISSDSSSSSSSPSPSICGDVISIVDSDFSDDDDDDDEEDVETSVTRKNKRNLKKNACTNGELSLDDLPPIQDLTISVEKDECVLLGNILSIVDKLVVVQGIKDLPPLNIDTVLFMEWDKPLGKVFDVFGPVLQPLYCVRFNSKDHIKDKEVITGLPVYYVPNSKHTRYVFMAHLMRFKGSDASWEDDNEPPLEYLEYSDDESERKARKSLKRMNRFKNKHKDEDTKESSNQSDEQQMNGQNLELSNIQNQISVGRRKNKIKRLIRPSGFNAPSTVPNITNVTSNSSPVNFNKQPPNISPSRSSNCFDSSSLFPFQRSFNNNFSNPVISPFQSTVSSSGPNRIFPNTVNLAFPQPTQGQSPDINFMGNGGNIGGQGQVYNANLPTFGNTSIPSPMQNFSNTNNFSMPSHMQTQMCNSNFQSVSSSGQNSFNGVPSQNMFSSPPPRLCSQNMFSSPPPNSPFAGNNHNRFFPNIGPPALFSSPANTFRNNSSSDPSQPFLLPPSLPSLNSFSSSSFSNNNESDSNINQTHISNNQSFGCNFRHSQNHF